MLADIFPQPRAIDADDSGSEHGSVHVHASNSITRRFPRIFRLWAPNYTFRHLFIIDFVPALALASHDASLSLVIFDLAT